MKANQGLATLLPLALTLSLACNQGAPPAASPASAANTATSEPPHRAQGEHGNDPANALLRAAGELQLTDPQKATIRSLEEQLEANERDTRAAFDAEHTSLGAQVRTGAIDQAKVRADVDAAASALRAHIAKEGDTLNGLHAALNPSQRKAVVAAVRASQVGRAEAQPHPGAKEPSPQDRSKKLLDHLTGELGLDPAQQQKVERLLATQPAPKPADGDDRRARTEALLTAFQNDVFDARTAVPAPSTPVADRIRGETDRQVAFLSELLPILTPAQREKLASSMEEHAMGHGDDD